MKELAQSYYHQRYGELEGCATSALIFVLKYYRTGDNTPHRRWRLRVCVRVTGRAATAWPQRSLNVETLCGSFFALSTKAAVFWVVVSCASMSAGFTTYGKNLHFAEITLRTYFSTDNAISKRLSNKLSVSSNHAFIRGLLIRIRFKLPPFELIGVYSHT